MICYRDMTFCPYWEECVNAADCERALTNEVWREAFEAGVGVAQFTEKPECFEDDPFFCEFINDR